ncbi:hypothetical protein FUA48_05435 [Flavobacterium alkalisoli]|uniref:Uncharacterized protein n=1 Tax=Flavobacterium alkalisoli TaxID=2602769 RepID=A0A5B9FPY7_9FLAO|nr:hypothetical protein [Flavobacterium alkalisoli]QEE49040.1 hypothetical protein FUA48_05435 [Flavobacterium alkalisoli]
MKLLRQITILIIGFTLVYLTWRSKHEVSLFDAMFWIPLLLTGTILALVTLYKEIKLYRKEKKLVNFTFTYCSLSFIIIIITLQININSNFSKPTLLRASYDGDFNGSSIDFKTDSTYIFENFAIGFSTYIYGNYRINQNKITLDTNNLDNLIETDKLEIQKVKTQDRDSIKKEKYLFPINDKGEIIDYYLSLKVVEDNRG